MLTGTAFGKGLDLNAPGAVILEGDRNGRYLSIRTEYAVKLFEKFAVKEGDIIGDELGLYSHLIMGRDLKARFASLTTPKHVLQSRKSGCTWNPKGKIRNQIEEVNTFPVELMMEQCPDALWDNCMEVLLGEGTGKYSLQSTEEARALLAQIISRIYLGTGNSFHGLANFSNHPLIDSRESAGGFVVSDAEWDDYYDQQTSTELKGAITLMDELRAQGERGFDLDLPDSAFNASGEYTGDIIDFLGALQKSAPSAEMRTLIRNGYQVGRGVQFPAIYLSAALFEAYEKYLIDTYTHSDRMLSYLLQREDGTTVLRPNMLTYRGMPVVNWDVSTAFDETVGAVSHRAAIIAPGAIGIASDVSDLQQYDGMGMQIQQSTHIKDKGKIWMNTTFRVGAAIAQDMICYAANAKLTA